MNNIRLRGISTFWLNCMKHSRAISVLIANRGEIAMRIARAADILGYKTVGVCSSDDITWSQCRHMNKIVVLNGRGPEAYLDQAQLIDIAKRNDCSLVHPGYGFLSENAEFADLCTMNHIKFVGPTSDHLKLFGDKSRAREVAERCNVPVIPGTNAAADIDEAQSFFQSLPPHVHMMIKAKYGGGGRGIRVVRSAEDIPLAMERCRSEAERAFGDGSVYVEMMIPSARHIEVQIIGDGVNFYHFWERECSLQRSHQKIVEVAPSPSLGPRVRAKMIEASLAIAKEVKYVGLGTFEFLLDTHEDSNFYFMEANPRLQVEHTVTEAVTGVDLVSAQFRIALGGSLPTLLEAQKASSDPQEPPPVGYAMQCRVNMETLDVKRGLFKPTGGVLKVFEPPTGVGVRVDAHAAVHHVTSTKYDSLLAKLIVHSSDQSYEACVQKMLTTLTQFNIEGFPTNIPFLLELLCLESVRKNAVHTMYVDQMIAEMRDAAAPPSCELLASNKDSDSLESVITAPVQGTLISLHVSDGMIVHTGQQLAVLEAMKMEHVVSSPRRGVIVCGLCRKGDALREGQQMFVLLRLDDDENARTASHADDPDPGHIRPDLQEVLDRLAICDDSARPDKVAKRHKLGRRTARENLADLVDAGSFIEYGALAIAAQRQRRRLDDLIHSTPADGLVCGIGSVNGDMSFVRETVTSCVVMSYEYMVLAGTQGLQNHRKKDRMFELAESLKLPVVLFAEGGGGRPGDTDTTAIAGLDCLAFALYAKLSGQVPRVGIANGRCFAGNAALLGASDVIIATPDANIGMAGPAMIEGGGMGVYQPEDIGPVSVQTKNGVVDILARDDADAVQLAKKYLSYFQGSVQTWDESDQRILRKCIPEQRRRIYDVYRVLQTVVDSGSLLELRAEFGKGMITAFGRVEGKPIGIIANNPAHKSGAIDSDCADKAARFMQLCNAFDIPMVSFCDTPGIMVGPEAESTALVRHAARLFVTSANISVPLFCIVLRKGYGLGAQAMAGGSFKRPNFTISWPTGEFGGMGLEGAVKLGFKNELEAIENDEERNKTFQNKVDALYENGKAVNYATAFELDAVIDPADTRNWISRGLNTLSLSLIANGMNGKGFVDTW